MIDAISRLIDLVFKERIFPENEFLTNMREFIDENKFKVMFDEEEFVKFLNELVRRFAKELKRKI